MGGGGQAGQCVCGGDRLGSRHVVEVYASLEIKSKVRVVEVGVERLT
jgi:hypothetical protein